MTMTSRSSVIEIFLNHIKIRLPDYCQWKAVTAEVDPATYTALRILTTILIIRCLVIPYDRIMGSLYDGV